MILNEKVEINVSRRTLKYWLSKGYTNVKANSIVEVYVKDLPKGSNIVVRCKCITCKREYDQRYSRYSLECGYCKKSKRMKNNILGKKNGERLDVNRPSKENLSDHFFVSFMTKKDVCQMYNISFPVLNRWLREYDIVLPNHYGKKIIKQDESDVIQAITSLSEKNMNISEISKTVGLQRHIITYMKSSGKLPSIKTAFDLWEESYQNICKNLDFYIRENTTKTLKLIADENTISVEQLKKAFNNNNIDVKLHSYNKSKGELECKEFIESLGFKCYSAKLDKIYEIDCYVPSKGFGVEYCGEYWHQYKKEKNNKYYHKNKTDYAYQKNIGIMTIFESEWKENRDVIKSMIRHRLGLSNKIHARACKIVFPTKNESDEFHINNHLSGKTNSTFNFGLEYKGKLVSVLSIVTSRFDKTYQYEISRFSNLTDYTVVGGLSRLFKTFVKEVSPKSCMTYVDLRVGRGDGYKNIGFKYISTTSPNYFYYHPKIEHLETRHKYQKHKLVKMPEYNILLSEQEIMENAGYYRIYNCGNIKYGWEQ